MSKELEIAKMAVQMYAESHPRPCHVSQVQAAEMLNVSRQTVARMIKSNQLSLNRFGLIPISEIDGALQKAA